MTSLIRLERVGKRYGRGDPVLVDVDLDVPAGSRVAAEPEHVEAYELLERSGGPDQLAAMYDRLVTLIATRPRAKVIHTRAGQVREAYQALLDNLGRHL